ncbi:lysylphosphatidylglycerol synthase transmembrane domain-containing protein [Seonamhaeicola marinus]|uniref:Flippase-like domain-containing protein n=1 Tax=Seonamhaeicola marinus TaxID=1912246 RepID=A0A5D0JH69_9FLAO|nr:lysylphosphatidylglycerol synthase transmembrane domain-containing protein [Seonamhaeicola marinus]TYA94791.1 flippase-like domain-containing protein [Seonamhaeicola marinus]
MNQKALKKKLKFLLKLTVSILLLYIVLRKIDINEVFNLYKNSNPFVLFLGIILLVLSQIVSSFRLTNIFHHSKFMLTEMSNLKLYFVGMFYNFFIPGGIGGDAYKVFVLNKTFNWKVKTLTQSVILDRLIGLIVIIALVFLLSTTIEALETWMSIGLIIVSVSSYFIGKTAIKLLFKTFDSVFLKSFFLSVIIQLLQAGTIYCLTAALLPDFNWIPYVLIFLVSSVLSVVSFSGFGVREFVFLQASAYFLIDTQVGIAVGLAFNLITALVSLIGVYFIIFKIKLTQIEN